MWLVWWSVNEWKEVDALMGGWMVGREEVIWHVGGVWGMERYGVDEE